MDTINYIYNGKSWKASPTVSDKNSFFHAAFGKRVDGKGPYLDKLVKFRRSRWATFLSRFQNEAAMPPLVADMLQKCFSANEKYKHVSVEDQDHFQGYILDIMSAVYDVTMEEIHILATLENESVVLFKAGESEPVVIVDPDTEVFASYGCIEEPKGDVVLYLEGNVFSRMNPVLDSVIKYEKGGTAGIKGVEFQVSLLTVFFLNALQKLTDWQLFTEYTAAGKFDDVVMVWPDGATLLQAKYIQNKKKKITLEELLANSRNDNFSIPKYFFSFKNIKKSFKIREVIICTTASVDSEAMKFLKAQQVDSDSLLHYDDRNYQFYTFNDNILPKLMENVKRYYEVNRRNLDVDIKTITETNIQEFLRHLQLFSDYPAGKVIERLMSRIKNLENFYVDVSHKDIYYKMLDWFRQEKGECMTELYAKAIVSEINRDKHWQRLEKYKISFQRNDLDFLISNDSKRLFHFIVEGGGLLQEIHILQTLHSNQIKFLFVNPSDGTEIYKQVEAFHLPKYTILVLVWPKITEEDTLHEVGCKLKKILDKFEYKKVVLIADRTNKIPQLSGLSQDNCKIINKPITLRDLSKDSQERILQKKKIIFQGSHVSLKEVLADQANEDYATFLNTEELEKLVRGEMINVGRPILELDEHIKQFYIKREFKKEKTKEIFPEELICEMREKVVLISDSAGMGKSTVLTNLAVTTKKKYPHLWVIRINLNDHTEILNEFLRKNRKSINILELLDSKDATKLTNQLERSLFAMNAKVVLMLDGFDEIGPDYTQLVLSLLSHSQKQQNFAKVIVTTRPHMARELEEKLQVESFVLEPFVKQNQIDFLVNYWMHNLKPDNNQRAKCEKFADELMYKMSCLVTFFEHFAALPLHVRMIAEIFEENNQFEMSDKWEGCKEYLVGDGIEPKLPEKMNVTRLYKMFIEKKRNVFVDKENPNGNTAVNLALQNMFEECQEYHKNQAIELILGKTKCKLFSCRRQPARNLEINVLKIGIVQKVDNIFQFAHRTYAEYFVAESLIEELQLPNENIEFQKFLIEEILLKYPIDIIHVFINSFLQEMIDKLSSNTLCKYQCVSYKITYFDAHKVQLINAIVKFGHLAIFQFILKCVDLNFFPKKLKGSMQFFQTPIGESIPEYSNVLNLVQQEAFVEPILISYTFLYHAAAGGHLEMVKFLVEQGANVNIVQFNPLQGAVRSGNFEVVKFLVEKGGYVDFADRWGTTALHIAVEDNNFRMAELLLNLGANVDFGDQDDTTALHTAVEKNNFQLAELLVNRGANVNLEDMKGNTALHLAAEKLLGNIIKFLVKRDANINSKNKADCTALYLSIGKYCTEENECPNVKKLDLIKFLIESGKDVNIKYADGSTVLHLAAKAGNLDIVNLLMEFGIDADIMDNNGQTALHVAALENHTHIVKFLMQHNADSNIRDIDGQTVLHSSTVLRNSIRNNDRCDVLKLIIEKAADINLKDNYGSTALYLASMRGDIDAVNLLVKHGADVNISNAMGATGLHLAALNGFSNVVECLVKSGADVNSRNSKGCTPLHLVAEVDAFDNVAGGHLEIVKFLVEQGANVNIGEFKPLHAAVDGGNFEVLKFLVEKGADVNAKDTFQHTALYNAYSRNDFTMVTYLLDRTLPIDDLNTTNSMILYRASFLGRIDILEKLMERGLNINSRGKNDETILFGAVRGGQLTTIRYLVQKGCDINGTDFKGNTALHIAVEKNNFHLAELLVNRGANVDFADREGTTALHIAVTENNFRLAELLINRGANVNFADQAGTTALHIAVVENNFHLAKLLVDCGVNVDFADLCSRTALHIAVKENNFRLAELLVNRGANVNLEDMKGNTALHLAAEKLLGKIIKFLVKRDANINSKNKADCTALYLSIGKYCTEENECPNVKKLDLIKFLIESGKDVNIKDADGSTVLHLAAKAGNLDIVNLLMEFGIDADIMDNNGQTALHVAALGNRTGIVKFLMQHNADCNIRDIEGQTVLHSSTVLRNSIRDNDRCDVLKLIIEKAADINLKDNYGSTALHFAIKVGDIDAVNLLVKHGADLNISDDMGATGLHLATLKRFSNIVECLVKSGADVNIKDIYGLSALQIAVDFHRLDIAKSLIKHGANINDLAAALLLAAKTGKLDIVVFCVEIGVQVNVTDGEGYTALQLALDGSHLKIVDYLVEMGADLTGCKNYEPSAMCLAAKSGDSDFMTSLLECCTGINVTDKHGNTALHLAVPEGLNIVKFLLDFGIDVNIKNNKGQTALHLASDKGCLDIAIFLVENGAELNISDNRGSTALHLAACSLNLVKFLVERGADIHLENNNGDTAGFVAMQKNYIAAFKYLQKKEYADEEEEDEEDDEEEIWKSLFCRYRHI